MWTSKISVGWMFGLKVSKRTIFRCAITETMDIVSNDHLTIKQRPGKLPLIDLHENRPLVLLMKWLNAKPKPINRYINLYLHNGFDVLAVSATTKHLMWPTIGAQVTASQILDFLHENIYFQPIITHCLSVGTYTWCETLSKAAGDLGKYRPTLERVRAQIFDSPPAPPPKYQNGLAFALFPNNPLLRLIIENVATFQLFVLNHWVTRHYHKATEVFNNLPVPTPSLMLISKDDLVSSFDINMKVVDSWKSKGINGDVKWWESSPHVCHFYLHTEDYVERINLLLNSVNIKSLIIPEEIKTKPKLQLYS